MANTILWLDNPKLKMRQHKLSTKFNHNNEALEANNEGIPWTINKADYPLPSDVWNKCEDLFSTLTTEQFILTNVIDDHEPTCNRWQDEDLPNKIWSLNHSGPVYGLDVDYMAGLHDWYKDEDTLPKDDWVKRRKVYLYNWSRSKLLMPYPELEYFMDIYDKFLPVMKHCEGLYSEQTPEIEKYIHKLMIIEYSTPNCTDAEEVFYRKHCTERFGDSHCDETMAGLHLGENYSEFEYYNHKSKEWAKFDFTNDYIWMNGLYSKFSGYKPTYHRMVHNPNPKYSTRYSIIFDLQPRYKEN